MGVAYIHFSSCQGMWENYCGVPTFRDSDGNEPVMPASIYIVAGECQKIREECPQSVAVMEMSWCCLHPFQWMSGHVGKLMWGATIRSSDGNELAMFASI